MTMISVFTFSQVGINTKSPISTLTVVGNDTKPHGITAPVLTGNELKAKDSQYDTPQTGTFVFVTAAASPTTTKTQNVTEKGYYYFDGTVWINFKAMTPIATDATRFLGGTVFAKLNNNSGGTLDATKVIGGGNTTYNVGSLTPTSKAGGINSILGNSYTISNPSNGIFDIKFNEPLKEIFGISVNIYDSYGPTGVDPVLNEPGNRLYTNDNSQVAFISSSIIRIKTGDSSGALANRPFTFLVTGR